MNKKEIRDLVLHEMNAGISPNRDLIKAIDRAIELTSQEYIDLVKPAEYEDIYMDIHAVSRTAILAKHKELIE